MTNRFLMSFVAVMVLAVAAPAFADEASQIWPSIKSDVFGATPIAEEDGTIALEAPIRAEDAALVPFTMTVPEPVAASARKITLLVDYNPVPVAATFTFGPAAGTGERKLTTRLRVDRYTHVRAILETDDGKLHMTTKFVKASGGCSAPAEKDGAAALANLGKMQVKSSVGAGPANEAQVMIKHPNYTGMQMNQLTRDYTPARYIEEMEVKSGGNLIFKMAGGISISENPHFRFTHPGGPSAPIEVTARDTEGAVFTGTSHPSGS